MFDTPSLPFSIAARIGARGSVTFIARRDGQELTCGKYVPGDASRRSKLAQQWARDDRLRNGKLLSAVDIAKALEQKELDAIKHEDHSEGANAEPEKSQASLMVELAADAELFHTPGADGDGYARIPIGEHFETHAIASKGFRRWLCGRFWATFQKAPGTQAVQDAVNVIASKALFDGPELKVHVRLAEHDSAIWLDLADAEWRAVRIDAAGWQVMDNPPVKFVRPRGMLPLIAPTGGGAVDELRAFVNVESDEDWTLLVSWLLAALRPTGPYPVLVVNGEQGSAKSTTCRMLRALIDANKSPLRAEPKEPRDLMIAAANAWVLGFDNLSRIREWLSDAICRLATGGGFATRELYTDDGEKLFDSVRPLMVNGISELASRSDLLDRALCLTLPPIPAGQRRTEAELWARFDEARPRILGALLTAVSTGLRNLADVRLEQLPRMADFARWVTACEPALGWSAGTFMDTYTASVAAGNDQAIEAAAVGPAIVGLMEGRHTWAGTAQELLAELAADRHSDQRTRDRDDWPRTPRAISNAVRRLAPNLRRAGINVDFRRETGSRVVALEWVGKTAPTAPNRHRPPSDPPGTVENADLPFGANDDTPEAPPALGANDGPGARCPLCSREGSQHGSSHAESAGCAS